MWLYCDLRRQLFAILAKIFNCLQRRALEHLHKRGSICWDAISWATGVIIALKYFDLGHYELNVVSRKFFAALLSQSLIFCMRSVRLECSPLCAIMKYGDAGVVLDVGSSLTYSVPVIRGRVAPLPRAANLFCLRVGGERLTSMIQEAVDGRVSSASITKG